MKIVDKEISKKMKYEHKNLAAGRWNSLSFFEQMANIGSEVERAIKWKEKGYIEYGRMAFDRSLELLDLARADKKISRGLRNCPDYGKSLTTSLNLKIYISLQVKAFKIIFTPSILQRVSCPIDSLGL
jgi:hypothetical protein